MTTIYDIKKRAQQLSEKTDSETISPQEVGGLFSDLADYTNDVEVNGSSLGIRKTYTSVSAMEADKNPVGDDGKPLKKGQLVNIYNQDDPSSADNNKVFSWQNPGWQIRTTLDAGYATREELTELEGDRSYLFIGGNRSDRYKSAGYFDFIIDANLYTTYDNKYYYYFSAISKNNKTFSLMKKSKTDALDLSIITNFSENRTIGSLSEMIGDDGVSIVLVDWSLYNSTEIISGTSYEEGVGLNPFLFNRKEFYKVVLYEELDNVKEKGLYKVIGVATSLLLVREEPDTVCQCIFNIYNNEIRLEKRVLERNTGLWGDWIGYNESINENLTDLVNNTEKVFTNIVGTSYNLLNNIIIENGRVNYKNGTILNVEQGAHYKIPVNPLLQSHLRARIYKNIVGSDVDAGYAFLDDSDTYITGSYYSGDESYMILDVPIPSNAAYFLNTAPQNKVIEEGVYAIYKEESTLYNKIITLIEKVEVLENSAQQIQENKNNIDINQTNVVRWFENMKSFSIKNDETIPKILFIGNSFAVQSVTHLPTMLKSVNKDIIIGVSYSGGATLEYYDTYKENINAKQVYRKYKKDWVYNDDNYTNTLLDKINDENWDLICLQQGSASAGLLSTYQPFYDNLKKWAADNAPVIGFKNCWLMAWAWTDNKITTEGGNLDGGQNNKEMYDNILAATKKHIVENNILFYFPSGLVIQELLKQYTQEQIWLDGQHLTPLGVVAASMTLFKKITSYYWADITLNSIPFDSSFGISEEDYESVREIVNGVDFSILSSYEFDGGNDYTIYYNLKSIKGAKWDITLVSIENPDALTANLSVRFRTEQQTGFDASSVASFSKNDIGQTKRIQLTKDADYLFLYTGFLNVNAKYKISLVV